MVTRYNYDELGNLLRQIDSLNRTNAFEYDALGRRVKETMPQGQSQSFAYDAVGNLKLMTNFNSVVLTNSYDLLNRVTNKALVNGYAASFAYSATGQRTNMLDASGTTSYILDSRDRITSKASAQGTLNYGYDNFGNLQSITSTTSNGVSLAYGYDALNRVTNVTQASAFAAGYNFDAVGNLQTVRLVNAVTNTWLYNSLNRLTNITAKTSVGTIASFNYKLAAAGNRTNLFESVNGSARTNLWGYDALYRLTNETITGTSPTGTISYKYDGVGNRTNRTSTVSGVTNQSFAYVGNDWLTTDAYDSNGNTRTNGANNYAYDVENRLTNSTTTGTNITMLYNGDGLRVAKTIGTNTTLYLLDDRNPTGYIQVLEEKNVSGGVTNLSKVFTYGLNLLSQRQVASGTTHYYGHDGNGNVRYLTATNGTISDTYAYEAFGTVIASTGTTPNDYRFSGEQYDPNLGFTYLRARYLNPGTGRFWTRDSHAGNSSDPASLHRYLYVQNNPVNNNDPTGMFTQQLGYAAEEAIQKVYAMDHPGDAMINGKWTRLGGAGNPAFKLKPDILNVTTMRWAEVKPLSYSGLAKAGVQYAIYLAAFTPYDYYPDVGWQPSTHYANAGSVPIVFFNAGGVIFYTDALDLAEDGLAIATIAEARQLFIKYGARAAGRTLMPARARISALAAGGKTADTARLESHAGIAVLLGLLGAP